MRGQRGRGVRGRGRARVPAASPCASRAGPPVSATSTPKTRPDAVGGQHGRRRPVGDDLPAVEHHEAREEVTGQGQVVEDGEDRRAVSRVEVGEELHDRDLVAEVQVDRRLVEDEQRRRLGDGERDEDQLALAKRELAGVATPEAVDPDPRDRGVDGGAVGGARAAERILVRAGGPAPPPPPRASRRAAPPGPARPPAAGRSPAGRAWRPGRRRGGPARCAARRARPGPAAAWTCRRRWAPRAPPARRARSRGSRRG